MELLRQLFGNDEQLIKKFVDIFKTQTPLQVAELHRFLLANDTENAAITAHSIKSQCRYFELEKAVEYCESIENQPDAGNVMDQWVNLEQEIATAIKNMKQV